MTTQKIVILFSIVLSLSACDSSTVPGPITPAQAAAQLTSFGNQVTAAGAQVKEQAAGMLDTLTKLSNGVSGGATAVSTTIESVGNVVNEATGGNPAQKHVD